MQHPSKRIVLITGGSSGIGFEMVDTMNWLSRLMPWKSVNLIDRAIPDNMKTLI